MYLKISINLFQYTRQSKWFVHVGFLNIILKIMKQSACHGHFTENCLELRK